MSSIGHKVESRMWSRRACGSVGCWWTLTLPSSVYPPFALVAGIPCAVVSILSASFRGAGSCLLVPVEGRGFGSSAVAQKEPICDLCRSFAPAGDEALSA